MYNQYNRKYQKVSGWWVYVIKTPDNMYYPGYSGGKDGNKQCWERWNQTKYKRTALWSYIEEFGWDNLEKIVIVDGLTEDEAVKWEGTLIKLYRSIGCCINILGSHWKCKYDKAAYKKEWAEEHKDRVSEQHRKHYQEHCEEIKEKSRLYRQEHLDEVKEKQAKYREEHRNELKIYFKQYNKEHSVERSEQHKQYYQEHKEKIKEKSKINGKIYRSTPEGKIYERVKTYNRTHTPIETPLEAKRKYLESGYIPDYIKSNDL